VANSFFQHRWSRRVLAGLLGLALGLLSVAFAGWLEHRSLRALAAELRQAYAEHDARAMEKLFCWDGVDDATRARVRLVILQEFELAVAGVAVKPLSLIDRTANPGLRPNLPAAATIEVTYDTPDHLTSAFLAGRDGWFRHRLVVMVPAN
jgi:hypothetical protein